MKINEAELLKELRKVRKRVSKYSRDQRDELYKTAVKKVNKYDK